jgi:hypothetical protein
VTAAEAGIPRLASRAKPRQKSYSKAGSRVVAGFAGLRGGNLAVKTPILAVRSKHTARRKAASLLGFPSFLAVLLYKTLNITRKINALCNATERPLCHHGIHYILLYTPYRKRYSKAARIGKNLIAT